jgi:hypothetical protein
MAEPEQIRIVAKWSGKEVRVVRSPEKLSPMACGVYAARSEPSRFRCPWFAALRVHAGGIASSPACNEA